MLKGKKKTQKWLLWTAVFVFVALGVATAYAVLPTISINSPTSFPVDI